MPKIIAFLALILLAYCNAFAQTELTTDCTVTFSISVEDAKANARVKQSMAGATKVVYIKGSKTRSDLVTPGFKQITFSDSNSDSVVILKEFGKARYMTYLSGSKRNEQSRKYSDVRLKDTDEKKTILGYECKKVIATLTDGTTYEAFYTPLITPSNTAFEIQFKDVPGFVLEYGSGEDKSKIKYSATNISFLPIPAVKFDIPVAGYRIL